MVSNLYDKVELYRNGNVFRSSCRRTTKCKTLLYLSYMRYIFLRPSVGGRRMPARALRVLSACSSRNIVGGPHC